MKFYPAFLLFSLVIFSCNNTTSTQVKTETATVANSAALQNGKQIFYARCASCHMVNKELTGPALRGVEDRWQDKEKLHNFIRNSQEVVNSDAYARELWLKFNQTSMPPHTDLDDAKINDLLSYIKSVSEPAN